MALRGGAGFEEIGGGFVRKRVGAVGGGGVGGLWYVGDILFLKK
jgi:hypothetical protein